MKIAIVGAGVAGPTAAFWLEHSGHDVTLIEQSPHFRTGGYIIDFWGIGYKVAERMGILPAVHEAGYTVREVRFVGDSGRTAGSFSTDVIRRMVGDGFTSLPRGDLAQSIYQSVEGRIETIFGDTVAALEQDADGVHVELESAGARDFDLLIGADGLHSRIRELVFGPQSRFEHDLGYRVAAFEADGYAPRDELVYVTHASPGRQIARFSERNGKTLILMVYRAALAGGEHPDTTKGQRALLRRIFGDDRWETAGILDAMDATDHLYFDRVSQIRMDSWTKGRVALIGDAAACVSLLAGEGTGLAMAEAYTLAGELARAGGNCSAAFANHEALLSDFIGKKLQSAAAFASFFVPKTAAGVWLRNRTANMLRFGFVADRLIGRDLRDEIDLPDYEIRSLQPAGAVERSS